MSFVTILQIIARYIADILAKLSLFCVASIIIANSSRSNNKGPAEKANKGFIKFVPGSAEASFSLQADASSAVFLLFLRHLSISVGSCS